MKSPAAEKSCSLVSEVLAIARCLNATSFRVGNFILPVCSHQVPVSPTNLHIAQMHRHKVNGDNYTVPFHQYSFWNITPYFRLSFLHRAPYFGTFFTKAVANKSIKHYLHKKLLCFSTKNVGEIDPRSLDLEEHGRQRYWLISASTCAFLDADEVDYILKEKMEPIIISNYINAFAVTALVPNLYSITR